MKRTRLYFPWVLAFFLLIWLVSWGVPSRDVLAAPKSAAKEKSQPAGCRACHSDPASIVPKAHPPVKEADIAACVNCHQPDRSGAEVANPFSTRIHKAHAALGKAVACSQCHDWVAGERFGLRGFAAPLGNPDEETMEVIQEIMASWGAGAFMDALHAKADISCKSCHAKSVPELDDTLDNARCLACHGPMEKLAARSAPKDIPQRNPHQSHLGDIHCTVCHKAHAPSATYCLDCHSTFQMKIPGSGR